MIFRGDSVILSPWFLMISANLDVLRGRVRQACLRSGRDPADVTLVAVSKTFPADALRQAAEAGVTDFGENYVQELLGKREALAGEQIRWHFIGHLQSNKVRKAVAAVSRIQSIDSADLGARVGRVAAEMGRVMPLLIQVDLAGEATKSGVPEAELAAVLEALRGVAGISVDGLMAIPPFLEDPAHVRPYFKRLRELRDESMTRGLLARGDLSMGMSHDFEAAIEEGATIVRVGTAIFGERPAKGA